jgi:7-cyano-7-deazaguanine reductase
MDGGIEGCCTPKHGLVKASSQDALVAVFIRSDYGCGSVFFRLDPMAKRSKPLKQLGDRAPLPATPDEAQLERVPNPHPDTVYVARFTAPEFTTLCPVTGQPDFAQLVIDYVPDAWLLESKSLKLYLGSFRNHAAFHEDCTIRIGLDITRLVRPKWLRIGGYWFPRGGIPIDVFWQTGEPPKGIWLVDQGVAPYRGRA